MYVRMSCSQNESIGQELRCLMASLLFLIFTIPSFLSSKTTPKGDPKQALSRCMSQCAGWWFTGEKWRLGELAMPWSYRGAESMLNPLNLLMEIWGSGSASNVTERKFCYLCHTRFWGVLLRSWLLPERKAAQRMDRAQTLETDRFELESRLPYITLGNSPQCPESHLCIFEFLQILEILALQWLLQ